MNPNAAKFEKEIQNLKKSKVIIFKFLIFISQNRKRNLISRFSEVRSSLVQCDQMDRLCFQLWPLATMKLDPKT